eukprot:2557209-Prymnesium_polylepis.1
MSQRPNGGLSGTGCMWPRLARVDTRQRSTVCMQCALPSADGGLDAEGGNICGRCTNSHFLLAMRTRGASGVVARTLRWGECPSWTRSARS